MKLRSDILRSRFSNQSRTLKSAQQLNNLMAPRETIGINLNADEPDYL